jgi:hypothetical protein
MEKQDIHKDQKKCRIGENGMKYALFSRGYEIWVLQQTLSRQVSDHFFTNKVNNHLDRHTSKRGKWERFCKKFLVSGMLSCSIL